MRQLTTALLFLAAAMAGSTAAEDWPEWRGRGRLGVWTETGIVETFPDEGLAYTIENLDRQIKKGKGKAKAKEPVSAADGVPLLLP